MEKIIRDGKVAVAVSYGFGAGWSTWCDVDPMDAKFNQLILDNKLDVIREMADNQSLKEDDDFLYTGGLDGIAIEWVPVGTKFIIEEYDGSESLRIFVDMDWYEA